MNIFIMQNSIVRPLGRDAQNALIGFEGENDARTLSSAHRMVLPTTR